MSWLKELDVCDTIIPRSVLPTIAFSSTPRCHIVGFSDGSSVAHGGVLYLRWTDESESNIEVSFLGAKGKLNPIKGITVPRSEICGAFLLSRLAYSTEEAFSKSELNPSKEEKQRSFTANHSGAS